MSLTLYQRQASSGVTLMDATLVHRLFYPQVPLVFAARTGRSVSAMPVVSYLSLSMRPALVGVSCFPSGFTLGLALKSKAFSLSVFDAKHLGKVSKLAETSGSRSKTKVKDSGLKWEPGKALGAPVFSKALAFLECRVLGTEDFGDHVFVTGEVLDAQTPGPFTDYWDFQKYRPILYSGWRRGMTSYQPHPPQA